jgi:hypothetical protein
VSGFVRKVVQVDTQITEIEGSEVLDQRGQSSVAVGASLAAGLQAFVTPRSQRRS